MGRTAGRRKNFLCSSLYCHWYVHYRNHVLCWDGDFLQDRIRIQAILDYARLCIYIQPGNNLSNLDRQ